MRSAARALTARYPQLALVLHDQGQGFTPIDTGQRYDSTHTYF
jgi:hypothetical protein